MIIYTKLHPFFLTVFKRFFFNILLLEYFSPPWIPYELMISHLFDQLSYASSNHLANNHTVQRSGEYGEYAIMFISSSVK